MTKLKKRGIWFLFIPVIVSVLWVIVQSIFGMDPADALDEVLPVAGGLYVPFGILGLYYLLRKDGGVMQDVGAVKSKKKMVIWIIIGLAVLALALRILDQAVGIF